MFKRNKKILGILACASALSGGSFLAAQTHTAKIQEVKAARNNVSPRSYGVDVASYQSTNLSSMAKAGGQFAIVKVSEGTGYRNPKAASQIKSAIANNMMPMAYHFATFGSNGSQAVAEANYAVSNAKALGLPKGSYIACDWENGQGNNVNGGKNPSANAIIAFMQKVKDSGFQPLLYSGAYLLNSNINTAKVNSVFPNSLWVASYATMGRIDTPNFNYFPSMNGVAIWQFTDNWRGLNVDGNISLLPLSMNSASNASSNASSQAATTNINQQASKPASSQPSEVKTTKVVMHRAAVYDKNGNRVGKTIYPTYKKITVLGGLVRIGNRNYYKIGDNQYLVARNIDGSPKYVKHNAFVYTGKGKRIYVPTIKRGSTITAYGSRVKLHGRYYYRIGVGKYVKSGNIR